MYKKMFIYFVLLIICVGIFYNYPSETKPVNAYSDIENKIEQLLYISVNQKIRAAIKNKYHEEYVFVPNKITNINLKESYSFEIMGDLKIKNKKNVQKIKIYLQGGNPKEGIYVLAIQEIN